MGKQTATAEGEAVSAATATTETAMAPASAALPASLQEDADLTTARFVLSKEMQDELSLELQEALHQISTGFGSLTAPGIIFQRGQQFTVVDAGTIEDFVDKKTGEEVAKHIFRLEFDGGEVLNMMQSDARPRRVLAKAFVRARALGGRIKCGPYKLAQKEII